MTRQAASCPCPTAGVFEKLKPGWCVKGFDMDKNVYVGFSEVAKIVSVKVLFCLKTAYNLKGFIADCKDAFSYHPC